MSVKKDGLCIKKFSTKSIVNFILMEKKDKYSS